jgi:hypothetical protein
MDVQDDAEQIEQIGQIEQIEQIEYFSDFRDIGDDYIKDIVDYPYIIDGECLTDNEVIEQDNESKNQLDITTKIDDVQTGERSTGERSTGERSTGERSAGERSTGERSTGERSTGERSTGERSTGERSTGERSTGERSTGERSTKSFLLLEDIDTRPMKNREQEYKSKQLSEQVQRRNINEQKEISERLLRENGHHKTAETVKDIGLSLDGNIYCATTFIVAMGCVVLYRILT